MSKALKLEKLHCQDDPTLGDRLDSTTNQPLLKQLNTDWKISHSDKPTLVRQFKLGSYEDTLAFVNTIAEIAIDQDHHPEINFAWNTCEVKYHTHSCNDLSPKDFICAYRIDQITYY